MRQKTLSSGPLSAELQAPIPGFLSWMMIAIARCHKEPRAIVCSIGSTIRVQRAVDLAFVESIQVNRAIVDAILCATKSSEPSTLPSAGPSKSSEPSYVPSVPKEEEDERSGGCDIVCDDRFIGRVFDAGHHWYHIISCDQIHESNRIIKY